MPKFHVIPGTPTPLTEAEQVRQRIRAMPKPCALLQCHRCGGREAIQTKVGMVFKDGRASGGTKQLLCALCMLKGERVVLG